MIAATPARPAPAPAAAPDWDRRGLFVVAFAHGASDFYAGMIPLIVFFVAQAHGLSPVFQGLVAFLWYATSSIVQPFFGAYSDKHGRWWFLPAAVGLTSVGISLAGLASNPAILVAFVIVAGLGSAVMHPEAGRYAAMLSGRHKAHGISIFIVGGQIGVALGPTIAALALTHWRPGGTAWLILPGVAAVAALFVAMRHVGPRAELRHEAAVPAEKARADRPGISLMVASTALRQLVSASFTIFLPNLLIARGLTLVEAGQIVTVFLLVAGVGMYVGGSLGDRFGQLFVSVVTAIVAVPVLLGFFVLHGVAGIVALALGSMLISSSSAPGIALVQTMLPQNLGMALGLMNGVAYGIGSALVTGVGAFVEHEGAQAALIGVSFVPLLSAAAYGLVGKRLAAKRAAAGPPGSQAQAL